MIDEIKPCEKCDGVGWVTDLERCECWDATKHVVCYVCGDLKETFNSCGDVVRCPYCEHIV